MNETPHTVHHIRKRLPRSQYVRCSIFAYRQVQVLSSTRFGVGLQQALRQIWDYDGSRALPAMWS